MRKTKEEMLITREKIIQAGFDCFFQNGFEATSLTAVAQAAGVTRGAIYWHFEDKKALYRAVVDYTIERADITEFAKDQSPDLNYTERLADLFWHALDNNPHVEFIFKALNFASSNEEFHDVVEKIQQVKRRLWEFLDVETKVFLRMHGRSPEGEETSIMASTLSLMFEGMFLVKNVKVGIKLDKEYIYRYTALVTASLVQEASPNRWEMMREKIVGL